MDPTVTVIENFLRISGPWTLAGALLVLVWVLITRDRKNAADEVARLATAFEAFLPQFAAQCELLKDVQQALTIMGERVNRNGEKLGDLSQAVKQCEIEIRERGGDK